MLQGGDFVHEVVARRALDRPRRQLLAHRQNVLDDDVGVVARRLRPLAAARVETYAQRLAIAGGIGEAIDVIDAHAVNQAFGVEL